jgi:hypothetical protein
VVRGESLDACDVTTRALRRRSKWQVLHIGVEVQKEIDIADPDAIHLVETTTHHVDVLL